MDRVVALIAHDRRKPDMVAFAMFNRSTLSKWTIVATDSTGRLLEQKAGLQVERVLSGVEGGDLQIAARVATRDVDAVIFLVDPFDRHAHEPDIQGLQRVCQVHDVPWPRTWRRPTCSWRRSLWETPRSPQPPDSRTSRRPLAAQSSAPRHCGLGRAPTCIRKASQPVSLLYCTTLPSATCAMLTFWNSTGRPVPLTPKSDPSWVPRRIQ